jgi:D-serine deaminase-like pyridoxal phosphate-dependent protein
MGARHQGRGHTPGVDAPDPTPVGVNDVETIVLSAEHGRIEPATPNTNLKVGGRLEFIATHKGELVLVECDDSGVLNDIDWRDDLAK